MDILEYNSNNYRSAMLSTAEIVNLTQHVLEMKVGNSLYFVHLAHLRQGATHTVLVDYTDTYQEYKLSPRLGSSSSSSSSNSSSSRSSSSSSLVITSDDCCDFKRITITEVDGKLTVQREPRRLAESTVVQNEDDSMVAPDVAPKEECGSHVGASRWKRWIRLPLI